MKSYQNFISTESRSKCVKCVLHGLVNEPHTTAASLDTLDRVAHSHPRRVSYMKGNQTYEKYQDSQLTSSIKARRTAVSCLAPCT